MKPTPPNDGKEYLTWLEAAKEFCISDRTLRRLARQGLLKRYRQHGRREVLLSREELTRVLAPQPVSA